ncbi:trimeric intracellular cation channel family protein [Variovorax sp. YR752]|uniref:trimeric intracellular cation channel family protein n=1 Tax=Variovorax sp. YR752 TaxID=1884383 RepID=UPI003137E623
MPDPSPDPRLLPVLLTVVEALATIAFALSGLLEAARKRLDAVGVCVVAGLAAFGGGTLRDVLLDRRPFFWVEHAAWLWALLALCIAAMAVLHARHFAPTERAMQWPDALGLGLFSAGGTQIALAQGMPAIVAVLMGVVTAVFGGVLRDIVCNQIPKAFSDHRPYAVCAFVGAWVLVAALALGMPETAAVLLAAAVATGLRALALWTDFRLPAWSSGHEPND